MHLQLLLRRYKRVSNNKKRLPKREKLVWKTEKQKVLVLLTLSIVVFMACDCLMAGD